MFSVATSTDYSYQQTWLTTASTDHVILGIKSCHDPHILLSEHLGFVNNSYEVAFGINRNTESVMREGPYGANVVWIDTPDIMSCTDFRYLYICDVVYIIVYSVSHILIKL